jgi:hypothetical protein
MRAGVQNRAACCAETVAGDAAQVVAPWAGELAMRAPKDSESEARAKLRRCRRVLMLIPD